MSLLQEYAQRGYQTLREAVLSAPLKKKILALAKLFYGRAKK
ncbi:hypothetical protein [uncultured Cedecea sp.]|nr:hypothetical protein [uncultured Cedecea sp.]